MGNKQLAIDQGGGYFSPIETNSKAMGVSSFKETKVYQRAFTVVMKIFEISIRPYAIAHCVLSIAYCSLHSVHSKKWR
jgi:hypothetical protein